MRLFVKQSEFNKSSKDKYEVSFRKITGFDELLTRDGFADQIVFVDPLCDWAHLNIFSRNVEIKTKWFCKTKYASFWDFGQTRKIFRDDFNTTHYEFYEVSIKRKGK